MGIRLGRRSRGLRNTEPDPIAREAERPAASPPPHRQPDVVIDLRSAWWDGAQLSATDAALREELRARQARRDALRDLERLRARHWSGERLVEEGRYEAEWWEHAEADPHAVLGLLPGATLEEVASARRRIAQECHPDRLAPDADADLALRRMVAANAAYDRLRRALRPV